MCTPGETQSQSCGNCGSETRTCQQDGTWPSEWGVCTGEGECALGSIGTRSCGDCGYEIRNCTASCTWPAVWSGCISQGECSTGSTTICGNCGIQTCAADCSWGVCADEGVCAPGAIDTQTCGNCGTQIKTCQVSCAWPAVWESCEGQGACVADAQETPDCSCLVDICVGSDFYDYPAYGDCTIACACEIGTGAGQACEPTITLNSQTCDSTAPSTSIFPNGSAWVNTNVAFTLTCSDAVSGCQTTQYKIVDSEVTCNTTGLTTGTSGAVTCASGSACQNKVCYRSLDTAGNQESIQTSNIFWIDKEATTQDSLTVSDNFWETDGVTSQTITLKSTELGSGIGGSYGMMALIFQGTHWADARGYFGWNPTRYLHGADQMACSGGGYASKSISYGAEYITLAGCSVSEASSKTCAQLGWSNAATYGSPLVCGETDLGLGGCSGVRTHAQAVAFCEAAGARLCSWEEVNNDETRGTGCGYDDKRIWSSTMCDTNSYWTQAGRSFYTTNYPKECTSAESGGVYVRCCADTVGPVETTVVFTVKPASNFGDLSNMDIAFHTTDLAGNSPGWQDFNNLFSSGQCGADSDCPADTSCAYTGCSADLCDRTGAWTDYYCEDRVCQSASVNCFAYCPTSQTCSAGACSAGSCGIRSCTTEFSDYCDGATLYSYSDCARYCDGAGNCSTCPCEPTITTNSPLCDSAGPSTSISPDGQGWANSDISFTLTCSDPVSGCQTTQYKIVDSGATCDTTGLTTGATGAVTCASGSVCQSKVCYRSQDVANNWESVNTSNIFYIDKQTPTQDSLTLSNSYWKTDGVTTQTITLKSTELGSGIGGSYGMMALIFQGTHWADARGYFGWNPTRYLHGADQMACSGGGYASKSTSYGASYITLTGCSTNVSGNQRTVVFTVKPGSNFGNLADMDISFHTTDMAGNSGGWQDFNNLFSSGECSADSDCAVCYNCNASGICENNPSLSCAITSGSCSGQTVLKMSAPSNAHAELSSQTNYNYFVCCTGGAGLGDSCTAGDTVLKLSAPTNAHVEKKTQANYAYSACLSTETPAQNGALSCTYATVCPVGYTCLGSISQDTNSQIGDCDAYATKVCCTILCE